MFSALVYNVYLCCCHRLPKTFVGADAVFFFAMLCVQLLWCLCSGGKIAFLIVFFLERRTRVFPFFAHSLIHSYSFFSFLFFPFLSAECAGWLAYKKIDTHIMCIVLCSKFFLPACSFLKPFRLFLPQNFPKSQLDFLDCIDQKVTKPNGLT
jgi:hypothetical protein